MFCHIQAMLGLYPYAPLNVLTIDPHLPSWLPQITVEGLRVGKGQVSLRCFRQQDGTSDYDILDAQGDVQVIRQPNPWTMVDGSGKRLKDFLQDLLPAKQNKSR